MTLTKKYLWLPFKNPTNRKTNFFEFSVVMIQEILYHQDMLEF